MSSLCAWRGRTRRGDIRASEAHSRTSDNELGRNTIKRLLAEHGIAPAPERGRSMSWSTFLKAYWGAIAATDLFTVEVVNPFGLVRYHVLFVIDIATRCVCIGGITSDPDGVCLLFIHPPAHGSEVSPAARNTLDSARIPRASKLLICGLFQKGRVLAQDEGRSRHLPRGREAVTNQPHGVVHDNQR